MNRCRTCLLPDTKPDLFFDESGECSACRAYKARPEIDWDARKQELLNLLDKHNGRCIVPSSGGKDSTYQVIKLKELGADVTIVTATTCMLSDIGRKNIDNLSKYAKTIEVTPNRSTRAKLNRLGFTMVGDPSWPQHASIWSIPFKMAVDLKTPLIIWGENSQDQYGGPVGTEKAKQMTRRWCSEFGGLNGMRASDFVGLEGITEKDMEDYTLPGDDDMSKVGVEAHFLGAYIPWDSRRNAEVAIKHGLTTALPTPANFWDFENLDCLVTGLHDVLMYRKYAYGRGCAQISADIRTGHKDRSSSLEWVKEHDGLFPYIHLGVSFEETVGRMGMTVEDAMKTIDQYTNWSLFNGEQNLRPIIKEECCANKSK